MTNVAYVRNTLISFGRSQIETERIKPAFYNLVENAENEMEELRMNNALKRLFTETNNFTVISEDWFYNARYFADLLDEEQSLQSIVRNSGCALVADSWDLIKSDLEEAVIRTMRDLNVSEESIKKAMLNDLRRIFISQVEDKKANKDTNEVEGRGLGGLDFNTDKADINLKGKSLDLDFSSQPTEQDLKNILGFYPRVISLRRLAE